MWSDWIQFSDNVQGLGKRLGVWTGMPEYGCACRGIRGSRDVNHHECMMNVLHCPIHLFLLTWARTYFLAKEYWSSYAIKQVVIELRKFKILLTE